MLELKMIEDEAEKRLGGLSRYNEAEAHYGADALSQQDRYLDARLEGIESKLDARMEAMQRFQEQAEARFQKAEDRFYQAEERFSGEVAALHQTINTRFDEARRHSTHVAIATVAGVVAAVGLSLAVAVGWISEQGSYAQSYGETQVEIQRAAEERAEFREAVQAIQGTQQSILERLPPSEAQ
ncbi:hypothetical protein [Bisbaumannia pacifica]|nr:hypothetical protein [Halomonas pacifica]